MVAQAVVARTMEPFKQALRAALRGEPIDLDDFDGDDRELLTNVAVAVETIDILTEKLVDAKAQDVIIHALIERETRRAPAVLA